MSFQSASVDPVEMPPLSPEQLIEVCVAYKARFSLSDVFSREQAKNECVLVVMSSVFVASQSSCIFLCSREQIRLVENGLYIV